VYSPSNHIPSNQHLTPMLTSAAEYSSQTKDGGVFFPKPDGSGTRLVIHHQRNGELCIYDVKTGGKSPTLIWSEKFRGDGCRFYDYGHRYAVMTNCAGIPRKNIPTVVLVIDPFACSIKHRVVIPDNGKVGGAWFGALEPNGTGRFWVAMRHKAVYVVDILTGELVTPKGDEIAVDNNNPLTQIKFSPDGDLAAIGNGSGGVIVVNTQPPYVKRTAIRAPDASDESDDRVYEPHGPLLEFVGRRKILVAGAKGQVCIYDLNSDARTTLTGHSDPVIGAIVAEDRLITISYDTKGVVWGPDGKVLYQVDCGIQGIVGLAVREHGNRMVIVGVGNNGSVHVWDYHTGEHLHAHFKLAPFVTDVVFDPSGIIGLVSGSSGVITFLNMHAAVLTSTVVASASAV